MAKSRNHVTAFAILILLTTLVAVAPGQSDVRATLQPAKQRKPAPEFTLPDSLGKQGTLKQYQGKILVLDFWATWCHGCKEEIPWFVEFQQKYGKRGLEVVGVSMDEEGWKVVKPFIETTKVPYRIVLGNESIFKKYGLESMPDTFIIDRQGRVAAVYHGLIDKDDMEKNILAMLAER